MIELKNLELFVEEKVNIVNMVVMVVVKYVDFFKYCIIDYVFDWDNMLVFEGNIVFYM